MEVFFTWMNKNSLSFYFLPFILPLTWLEGWEWKLWESALYIWSFRRWLSEYKWWKCAFLIRKRPFSHYYALKGRQSSTARQYRAKMRQNEGPTGDGITAQNRRRRRLWAWARHLRLTLEAYSVEIRDRIFYNLKVPGLRLVILSKVSFPRFLPNPARSKFSICHANQTKISFISTIQ